MKKNQNKDNFISRINNIWKTKNKKFRITYLVLVLLAIILVSLCVWSLIVVDQTRNEAFNYFNPLYQAEVEAGTFTSEWAKFINEKYQGDVMKYSWLCASSSTYSQLSSVCYILCPITCLASAPILVYVIASFLIVAFPKKTKQEKIAEKKLKKENNGGKK